MSNEKITIKEWPEKLTQGSYGQLVKWKEQLPTQVLLASTLGESGATYLHYLTVFDGESKNRFLKPLLEPIESEQYAKLSKDARKRHEPVSLNEYLEKALEDELERACLKSKVNKTHRAKTLAEVLATATVVGEELDWPHVLSFLLNAKETPIKPEIEAKDTGAGEGEEQEDDQADSDEYHEAQTGTETLFDKTLSEDESQILRVRVRETVTKKAKKLRIEELRKRMTKWQAADSFLRMIMLKGIDTDPSGQLERCKTAFEMREAIDQFANASGVALTASIRQMDPLLEDVWDESDTAQTNAKKLLEIIETFVRAVETLCPHEDAVRMVKEAFMILKPYFLLQRGNKYYANNMETEAAMTRVSGLLDTRDKSGDLDNNAIYDAIAHMFHQWDSVKLPAERANQATARKVPADKMEENPCWLCDRSHVTKNCYCIKDGVIDESMLKNRLEKDARGRSNGRGKKKQSKKDKKAKAKRAKVKAARESEKKLIQALAARVQTMGEHSKAKAATAPPQTNNDADDEAKRTIEAFLGIGASQ